MKIIVGKTAGFCYGVRNAVEKTENVLKENVKSDRKKVTYCLGELVHNKHVIEMLKSQNLETIESLEEIPNPNGKEVIIRAHGITKEMYEKAEKLKIKLIDLTCPNVLSIHKMAHEFYKNGYYEIYIGEKQHPESVGTISFGGKNLFTIECKEDIDTAVENYKKSRCKKIVIFAQTTFNLEKFEDIVEKIKEKLEKENIVEEIVIKNTICNATRVRQEETKKIAKMVDCMIIIGGRKSSNTKKLYDISCENCKKVYGIEKEDELKLEIDNLNKYEKIGIMAGASTMNKSIEDVVNFLK